MKDIRKTERPGGSRVAFGVIGLTAIGLMSLALNAQSGTIRYVRAGATGSGSGVDWTNACVDFTGSCAVSSLVRGGTYYVAEGTYAARTWNRAESGSQQITILKATASNHGSDTGWSSSYGDGQAVFVGANTFSTGYWTFDGQVGDYLSLGIGSYGFKFDFDEGQLAITNHGDFNTFRYIDFDGVSATGNRNYSRETKGLAAYGGDNWTISHCAIHGGESLIQGGGNNWLLEYTYMYNARSTAAAFHSNVFYASSINGGVFRYNRIWDYNDEGLFFTGYDGPVSNVKVYGNVFFTEGNTTNPRGIELRQDYGYSNIEIYNNTFSRLGVGGILNRSPETGDTCSNCVAHNNLSYQAGNTLTGMTQSNNTADSTNRFVNLAAGDFRLTTALQGVALNSPYNFDLTGRARGSDGVWDRGAYEFTGGTSTPPPAIPTNVRVIR
jgi:hypothetical protein